MFKSIIKKSKIITYLIICFFFLICIALRNKSFIDYYLNIDEIVYLYLFKRSQISPLPFVGFDTRTSGPINILILKFFNLFGISINLITYRIILLSITLFSILFTIQKLFKSQFTKLITSMLLVSILFIHHIDFLAINSEYIILSVLFPLIYLFTKPKTHRIDTILFSVLTILLFFVKFQAVVLVVILIILFIIKNILSKNYQNIKYYFVLNILFSLGLITFFKLIGILPDFIHNYIFRNLAYPSLKVSPPFLEVFSTNFILIIKFFGLYILLILLNMTWNKYQDEKTKSQNINTSFIKLIKQADFSLQIIFLFLCTYFIAIYKLGIHIELLVPIKFVLFVTFPTLFFLCLVKIKNSKLLFFNKT